ncbi:MAG: TIGR00289 family protein [Candidatus Aenigmarchaeota archaeon]|nr:TIGR00289 family protein [Candidatus Aenigmarchaeota archaeon]
MKLAVLFSGGKDSVLAMHKAMKTDKVVCLITLVSENKESYMFHTPNIGLTKLQAEAIGLPLIEKITKGVKEDELKDLKSAISEARERFGIEGIVTGAVKSVYQAERIQKICNDMGLKCINPLWHIDERVLLEELIENGFRVMISGVFAYPLDKSWIGIIIDKDVIEELVKLQEKYMISPVGEGGEIETTALDAPFFTKTLEVIDYEVHWNGDSGILEVKKAVLRNKG